MRGDFHKAVTIPAVHSELLHVEVVRKKANWLGSADSQLAYISE